MRRRTRDLTPYFNISSIPHQQRLIWVMHSELTFEIPRTGRGLGLVLVLPSQLMVVDWLDTAFDLPMNCLHLAGRQFNIYIRQRHSSHLCSSQEKEDSYKKHRRLEIYCLLIISLYIQISLCLRQTGEVIFPPWVKPNLSYPGKREAANGSVSSTCPLHPSCVKAVIWVWLHINHIQGCRSSEAVNWSPRRPQLCTLWSSHTLAPDRTLRPPASIKRFHSVLQRVQNIQPGAGWRFTKIKLLVIKKKISSNNIHWKKKLRTVFEGF